MKYYYIREWDHDEIFDEYIVQGDDIDKIVEKYIDFRVKKYYEKYHEEITIEINKEPNMYGIYKGYASIIFEGELLYDFDITMKEVNYKNDIIDLN